VALTGQVAVGGLVASNTADGGNTSTGTATIVTGAATAVGTDADTTITQAATDADGDGVLDVTVQDATVVNLGFAVANSGLNDATGNDSFNLALTGQFADGLVALNNAGGSNTSDGNASIITGSATAVGVDAGISVDQGVADVDDDDIDIVFQQPFILNLGGAFANSGGNSVTGNDSFNLALLVQGSGGLVVANLNPGGGNTSSGGASITSGNANAAGTKVILAVRQRLA
jgi:hypothetical protein